MKAKRKKATAGTATLKKIIRQDESYQKPNDATRAKLQIGELLLCLQRPLNHNQRREYWLLFESMLKQYLHFKCSEVSDD